VKEELEALIEEAQEEEKYFKNYLKYARKIKKEAERLLRKVKVFVFGSILKKKEIARDIDILIVSPKLKSLAQKRKILAKLWKKFSIDIPFKFHLINPDEYKNWYRYFIKKKIDIK
jgi:predicted nucleotidyltransferase